MRSASSGVVIPDRRMEPLSSLTLLAQDPVLVGFAMIVSLFAPLQEQRYRLPGIVGIILVGAASGSSSGSGSRRLPATTASGVRVATLEERLFV